MPETLRKYLAGGQASTGPRPCGRGDGFAEDEYIISRARIQRGRARAGAEMVCVLPLPAQGRKSLVATGGVFSARFSTRSFGLFGIIDSA